MNILIFSPVVSHPQIEGNCKRIFTLTKYLQSLGHSIHFVYYEQFSFNQNNFQPMMDEWDTLTVIYKTKQIELSTTGYELDAWYQDDIHTTVNEVIDMFDIEVVLVNYIMLSKLLEFVPDNILKIIDTHDIFADRHLIYKGKNCAPYTRNSVSKEDEMRALNRADIILAIQKNEAKYFREATNKPVRLINHLEKKHYNNHSYQSLKKVGFIGSANHINDHSIHLFLDEFIRHPISNTIQIIIAGKICPRIKVLHPNIILKGIIENIEDFYNEVDLVINPLTFGTGLKIKSIEALAYGVPIISTKIGFEGIESQHEYHQIDTLSEMVDCISNIYKSSTRLSELEQLSQKIFDDYEVSVKQEIENVFEIQASDKNFNKQDIEHNIRKKEATIYKQHKQSQITAFKQREYEKKIKQQQTQINDLKKVEKQQQTQINDLKKVEKQQNTLMDLIGETSKLRLMKHPFKKYKAYKVMLKTYFKIRRTQK